MAGSTKTNNPLSAEVGLYECEVRLKVRIIEERQQVMENQDELLPLLLDALSYGSDEYLETLDSQVAIKQMDEVQATPEMRRQLIRLRNSKSLL
ncbi:Npun_R1517 family heterocyst differentiation transcriptional regulator [Romeria aff. gracilis LEGE 07310]|uniref:Npun_R1517 family heterocyst differentiation transcriptional regulator n=1 Tax=Vasconcelosia minhoensis LEGE 07310 TaxID=915328 RepID=A0A8J7AC05_9CYAN|nr:Npun_R1517 family heterocyst differentiation transcriptional regulator [Romeria gracilis]MBE9076859.1 Npun_R1517 family heterocyst differentiation transcriptional regulator [Romeria aff. gracilis LEGE 07310]